MLTRQIHYLIDLGFRDFVSEDPTDTNATVMDMQHDAHGILVTLSEKAFQDMHNKFHRRVIIVQHQNLVHRWLLRLGANLGDNSTRWCAIANPFIFSVHDNMGR